MMLYLARLQHLELHLSRLTTSTPHRRNSGPHSAPAPGSEQTQGHQCALAFYLSHIPCPSGLSASGGEVMLCTYMASSHWGGTKQETGGDK
ncbi:uncharacterized [Tachysurus ichikawai]